MRALLVGCCLLLLAGCESLAYYRQGIAGQLAFYGAREPIGKVLGRDDLAPEVRERLAQVPRMTAFAREQLQLPVKGQYRDYVQLDRRAVLWSVFAAPELSLDAYRWCYLFGSLCVEYRGYFRLQDAQDYAAKLAARGYDTHIGSVAAFSSLGLLDDPVTSVLTAYPEDLLASVLFHELAHAVVYVKDDTEFNESFASAVAEEGLARWLVAAGRADDGSLRRLQDQQALLTEVALAIRGQLAALYASPLSAGEKRARKQAILAGAADAYRARCAARPALAGDCPHAAWFGPGLNNARLNAVATYEQRVPAFARLLAAHDGDLAAFYRTVEELGDMPRDERARVLRALMPDTAPVTESAPP